MSVSLKIVSLNIERSKHLDLVIPFLRAERPDAVCLQELFESDISKFSDALGMPCQFAPMSRYIRETPPRIMGVGIFSKLSVRERGVEFYGGDPAYIPDLDQEDEKTYNNKNFPLVWCDVEKGTALFRVATTHFRWTPYGQVDDGQRRDMKRLLQVLESKEEFVLCGDFNAPRGGEIFGMLAQKYKDNIPAHYTTSIDGTLHRNGPVPFMVDGFFSTPQYRVSDVQLIPGVSDHYAIIAHVSTAG